MTITEMESKVQELRELRRMAAEIATEIETLEDSLKAHMTETRSDEITGPSFKITWKEVTSTRLDSKLVKAAVPEIWARCSKTTTARRFVVA